MGKLLRRIQKAIMSKKARCPQEEHCLELARLMLDDQSTEEESNYVMKHIDKCFRCYDNFDLENEIREAIKNKTNNLKVSEELLLEINRKVKL